MSPRMMDAQEKEILQPSLNSKGGITKKGTQKRSNLLTHWPAGAVSYQKVRGNLKVGYQDRKKTTLTTVPTKSVGRVQKKWWDQGNAGRQTEE